MPGFVITVSSRRIQAGWTLFELLVAIVIVGLLAVLAIPVFDRARGRADDGRVQSTVRSMYAEVQGRPLPTLEAIEREIPRASVYGDPYRTKYELARESDVQLTLCGTSDSGRVYCLRQLNDRVVFSTGSTETAARVALPSATQPPTVLAGTNRVGWVGAEAGSATYELADARDRPWSAEDTEQAPEDFGQWPAERSVDSPSAVCRLSSLECDGDLTYVDGSRSGGPGVDGDEATKTDEVSYTASPRVLASEEWTSEIWIQGRGRAVGLDGSWSISTDADGLRATVSDASGDERSIDGPAQLVRSVWYHVALVRSGPIVTLYLNGRVAGERGGFGKPSPALDRLRFGRFDGLLDEWAWYPRALPRGRLMAHAQAACQCQPQDVRD